MRVHFQEDGTLHCTRQGENRCLRALQRVQAYNPGEDLVGRQTVETRGAATPEVRELQERGGKTRTVGREEGL